VQEVKVTEASGQEVTLPQGLSVVSIEVGACAQIHGQGECHPDDDVEAVERSVELRRSS
jgi:hypothetical protein